MRTRKQKKYCCNSCDKKTFQTKFSEGLSDNMYYIDYKCDICGAINSFPTKTPDGQLSQAWSIKDNGKASLRGGRYEIKN